jgi:hypothetical protein
MLGLQDSGLGMPIGAFRCGNPLERIVGFSDKCLMQLSVNGVIRLPVRLSFQENSARRLLICASRSTSILRSVDFTPSNSR